MIPVLQHRKNKIIGFMNSDHEKNHKDPLVENLKKGQSFVRNHTKQATNVTFKLALTIGVVLAFTVLFYIWSAFGSTSINLTLKTNPDLEDGLIAHWTFDGEDTINNVADKSGNNNVGYLSGFTSTTTIPGRVGQALDFDGVDDYASSTFSSTVKSIAFWAKPDSLTEDVANVLGSQSGDGSQIIIVSGTTWTVPADWNDTGATIEALGAGGDGVALGSVGGGGGGGGEWRKIITPGLTANATYDINIAAGCVGSTTDGTWVKNGAGGGGTIILEAKNGGNAVDRIAGTGGTGGTGADGNFDGGAGGTGGADGVSSGAGGGGSAGPIGIGKTGGNGITTNASGGGGGGGSNAGSATDGEAGNTDGAGEGGDGGHGTDGTGGGDGGVFIGNSFTYDVGAPGTVGGGGGGGG